MSSFRKITNWLSSLKVAIALLIVIAIASALGTAIPQGESPQNYINHYNQQPLLGLVNGKILLVMNLDAYVLQMRLRQKSYLVNPLSQIFPSRT